MSDTQQAVDWSIPANMQMLEELHEKLSQNFPDIAWFFVRIIGRRWAFLCGEREELAAAPERIEIAPGLGICVFGRNGGKADPDACLVLTESIKSRF